MNLVTLAEAKRQVHDWPTNTHNDLDILDKIQNASSILMDYCELSAPPASWLSTDASPAVTIVPGFVKQATLCMVGALMRDREATVDVLSDSVKALLRRLRPLGIA